MKITNSLKSYKQCKVLVAKPSFVSIPNGHIPFCGEWVVYDPHIPHGGSICL
jgi:hypothetical protein